MPASSHDTVQSGTPEPASACASVLSVRGLRKAFGGNVAVDGVDFDVYAGEMLALIGPNGAGKSTTFNMVGGQLRASGGSVRFRGSELLDLSARRIARLGVGRTFQIAAVFGSMTVCQNVQMALLAARRHVYSFWRQAGAQQHAQALQLLRQVGMREQAQRPCSELAYGDVKRVELAMALAGDPTLLLMDEPAAGMAPQERKALFELIRGLARARGMAVLFTEHSMDVVFDYADRIIVLARGRLIAQGSVGEVRAHPEVRRVYFGSGASFEASAIASGIGGSLSTAQPPHGAQTVARQGEGIPVGAARPPEGAAGPAALLDVRHLNAWYGAAQILFDVALQVGRGEIVALMGRNGAGKSSTLKAVMGLMPRVSGEVSFMGQPLADRRSFRIARRGLGYVPEDRRVFTELTVEQNLETGRQAPRAWPAGGAAPAWSLDALYELFPVLAGLRRRQAGTLSGGEQQMLTIARTLMGNPYLVLLDEPSEGVAPVIVEQIAAMLLELKRHGVGVLLSEQNLHFAQRVADRAYVLEKGVLRHEGGMAELARNGAVLRAYLGI
ncbi:ATP-binding cassette domain-containing protein [Candidimonas nitroreducens]|uniref:Branched-chain amino acid ABC transporter ATP-binding protein n=1 Tax=Candidimonas nitroreducens TaxID=683354 RepID=A0A225MFW5_9BURK|nr:ATP-binding cassette domain-containing protein [Candidimonas nitroreducens]OWT60207.1 branched-chain amino acid ABC transporter ATP-binding protein [Candidimonas nitroreducens]